ncbi:hypothetical protein CONPUDRAFT_35308, partial [Coniophora puteana RWD-64-598 SS2]
VLAFMRSLHLRTAPNVTAWTDTLEDVLGNMGYKLPKRDNLRRRFHRAFHWYRVLIMRCDSFWQDVIEGHRSSSSSEQDVTEGHHSSSSSEQDVIEETSSPSTSEQPSRYLRQRCELCFGGKDWRTAERHSPDVIACIDACFTQKRSATHHKDQGRDPENPTETLFLREDDVKAVEHVVDAKRGSKGTRRPTNTGTTEEDSKEPGMRVPKSALESCHESFKAADDKREKASMRFFTDTGLMALLCRHDRVL